MSACALPASTPQRPGKWCNLAKIQEHPMVFGLSRFQSVLLIWVFSLHYMSLTSHPGVTNTEKRCTDYPERKETETWIDRQTGRCAVVKGQTELWMHMLGFTHSWLVFHLPCTVREQDRCMLIFLLSHLVVFSFLKCFCAYIEYKNANYLVFK